MQTIGSLIGIVIVIVAGVFVYNSFIRQDWIGIYESRASNDIYTEPFSSREGCAAWLNHKTLRPGAYTNYECGKNCEPPRSTLGLYTCQETF